MEAITDLVELTEKQAGKLAGVVPLTMNKWRYRGKGPVYYRVGGKIRYKRSDVLAWLESCRVDPKTRTQRRRRA
jgi:predicted site-specific integrase-resolvase